MGVKNVWDLLTPYCERKPIYELRGKKVAIDLAGWVCDSSNAVDSFVDSRFYLKNLFYRTSFLVLENVTPIFILEGTLPKLKSKTMSQRREKNFRAVEREGIKNCTDFKNNVSDNGKNGGRLGFQYILKQCALLLQSMGIQYLKAPGEAEAYCAFLNRNGYVDGVISQDSDCFAYGALRVYRNFTVSTKRQGGYFDLYDINKINQVVGIGRNKIIAIALLCGCDYCPGGVSGVGSGGVLKLLKNSSEKEILQKLKQWKKNELLYESLGKKVNDKNICTHCGHSGKLQEHVKTGCTLCGTKYECDESLWKEEREALKIELTLRRKALKDASFPSQEIIDEFLSEPGTLPAQNFKWNQPKPAFFIKQIGLLLQWSEIICFQKFLPLFTRWQLLNESLDLHCLIPCDLRKKKTVKGLLCLEVQWTDRNSYFDGLIPNQQIETFSSRNWNGISALWTTVEPIHIFKEKYPNLVEIFFKRTTSLKCVAKMLDSNTKHTKQKRNKKSVNSETYHCSTPKNSLTLELDSDSENKCLNISNVITGIIQNSHPVIRKHTGRLLYYESLGSS